MNNIGELIVKRRKELGLTLDEVGNAVGVGKSTVKKWEDGYIENMRVDKVVPLCKILNISVGTLLAETVSGENNTEAIKPGRYRHYKGNEYDVIGIAKHTETLEDMVIYRSVDESPKIWARPATMWNDIMDDNGTKRFTPVSQVK